MGSSMTQGEAFFTDTFDDGDYNNNWKLVPGTDARENKVTESDGTLRHQGARNYGGNSELQTQQSFDANGTIRIEVRLRTRSTDFNGFGFAVRGSNKRFGLRENKWEGFDRFAAFGVKDRPDKYSSDYGSYGEQTSKAKFAPATDSIDFRRYSLRVDLDADTITRVQRGDEVWDDLSLQTKAVGDSFRLGIPFGGGHDVEYDAIGVGPADGDWSLMRSNTTDTPTPTLTPTQTPTLTPTPTPTQTPALPAGGYPDGKARIEPIEYTYYSVELDGTGYLVMRDVETEQTTAQWAVTYSPTRADGDRLRLAPIDEAYSALSAVAWAHRVYADYMDKFEKLESERAFWDIGAVLNNLSNIGVQAVAAYVLNSMNPAASTGTMINLLEDSITWGKLRFGTPYQEALSKIRALTATERRVRELTENVTHLSNAPASIVSSIGDLETAYGLGQNVGKVTGAMVSAAAQSDGVVTSAKAALSGGAAAAAPALVYIFGSLSAEFSTAGYEANGKAFTLGHAGATVRLPYLRTLRDLKQQAYQYRLSPAQATRFQQVEATQHMVAAVANAGMAMYAQHVHDEPLGPLYDVLNNADGISEAASRSKKLQRQAAATALQTGSHTFQRARRRTIRSINAERWSDTVTASDGVPGA